MDERRKTIRDLEKKRYQDLDSLDVILKDLGETLLARLDRREASGGGAFFADPALEERLRDNLEECHRLLRAIAVSEDDIKAINADMVRLREVEEIVARKEGETAGKSEKLSRLYTQLGESLLEEGGFSGPADEYRKQTAELILKISSLEDRLTGLEEKDGMNVITWIGKNAQGLVLRSFLGKSRNNLLRIYAAAGKQWILSGSPGSPDGEGEAHAPEGGSAVLYNAEIDARRGEIEGVRKNISALEEELAILKDERKKIVDSFGSGGRPIKKLQILEKQAEQTKEQLASVYRSFGGYAAERAGEFAPALEEQDCLLLDEAGKFRKSIGEYESQIEKLKASLAIDEERAEIKKMERIMEDHRLRIAASENTIAELKEHIAEANRHIQELQKI
jgi:chromosome segregation ATPase